MSDTRGGSNISRLPLSQGGPVTAGGTPERRHTATKIAEYIESQVALQTKGLAEKNQAYVDGQLAAILRENQALRQEVAALRSELNQLSANAETYRQREEQIAHHLDVAGANNSNVEFMRWRVERLAEIQHHWLNEPSLLKDRAVWLSKLVAIVNSLEDRRKRHDPDKARQGRRAGDRRGS